MFQRINPDDLNGRQKEIYNFQKSAALLADYGFNCIKLTDDWQGADFLAHHFDGATTLKVQLKGRLTIDRKYAGQDLWMNFPCRGSWYLVPHDHLLELVAQTTNWLNTSGRVRLLAPSQSGRGPARAHRRRLLVLATTRRVVGELPHRTTGSRVYEHHRTLPREAVHPERPHRDEPVRGVS